MTKATKKPAPAASAKTPAAKPAAKTAAKAVPKAAAAPAPTKVGKTELTDLIVTHAGLSKKDAGAALGAALEAVAEALKSGKTVGLPGVGTLTVKATAARTGVRPGTSEKIQIPAGKKVAFKVAADLKKNL
ncbi:HU family DNA-binding protein [Deinococcus sp. KNUC1210]|uniref:HU family DNA-binding protein n=1 Tax=Deinococcus sp. KNUC1210 TaxID=2917691 RepID=UPI001EEF8B99|nr:HU family DNA-binding protein [Deinococcus sp. KNUC1210]ULH15500.1 HU family DNA-binding protein [Deinococcus sp. KNUC1210]